MSVVIVALLSSLAASAFVVSSRKDENENEDENESIFSVVTKKKTKGCTYGKWSDWSKCVYGKRKRTRTVVAQQGVTCDPSEEERLCGCIGIWEDDENGCQCGHATKKQTFKRLTHEVTQRSCVAADGQVRYVKCTQPSWCPTPSPSVPSPPASAPPTVSQIETPDCIGYWEDNSIGCNCNGIKQQNFRIAKKHNRGGVSCKNDENVQRYTRKVGCKRQSGCPT